MQIIRNLNKPFSTYTIGTFDGMHLGHQALLKRLIQIDSQAAVITFENHPSTLLNPQKPTKTLCTLDQKLTLFKKVGISTVVLLPFSKAFASLTAEEFLLRLSPFSHLLLGHDARLGKGRHGDPVEILRLSHKMDFTAEYFPPFKVGDTLVSSSQIRKHLQKGELTQAETLLGRPFSLSGTVITGKGKGKVLGFPTANVPLLEGSILPFGVYEVTVTYRGKPYPGIANLGVAPTVRQNPHPQLEVHLFDFDQNLYGQQLEVAFCSFLRPEKKFSSVQKLKEQIARDIAKLKTVV